MPKTQKLPKHTDPSNPSLLGAIFSITEKQQKDRVTLSASSIIDGVNKVRMCRFYLRNNKDTGLVLDMSMSDLGCLIDSLSCLRALHDAERDMRMELLNPEIDKNDEDKDID